MSILVCNKDKLANIGNACKADMALVQKVLFVSTNDSNGDKNKIAIADAISLTTFQSLINVYGFAANPLSKLVVSPAIYDFKAEPEDSKVFNEFSFRKKLKDGDYPMSGEFFDIKGGVVKKMKDLEGRDLSIILIYEDGKIGMLKKTPSATHFYMMEIGNSFDCANLKIQDYESISREKFTIMLTKSSDINDLVILEVLDASGDAVDMTDTELIYSLIDCTSVITSPAATGCTAVIATTQTDNAGTATPITGLKAPMFVFRKIADDTKVVATTITESPNGTYDVAATLPASATYKLEISAPGYDIEDSDVVVA